MGSWGPRLYQNDIAEEVKSYYINQLQRGRIGTDITEELKEMYASALLDSDDAPQFWFALADTQWKYGRLEESVKNQALLYIRSGCDIEQWKSENPKGAIIRAQVLQDLEQKLLSPQPPEKKMPQHRIYKCKWNLFDVFSYKIESNYKDMTDVKGRYFLFQKIGETTWYPEHIIPIVRVKITKTSNLPQNEVEFNALPYVQIAVKRPDLIRNKYPDENEIKSHMEPFGYLPDYRIKLVITSTKSIPKKVKFIGNYRNVIPPFNEYIIKNDEESFAVTWKNVEQTLLDRYYKFNLKHSSIYNDN